jgi:hypothetical protein
MTEEHKPVQLDESIEYSKKPEKNGDTSDKKNKALPWLLGVLVLLGVFYVIDSAGENSLRTELTPEQQQIAETVTESVSSYVEENGVPDDPGNIQLSEGSEIVFNDDGSWIVSTAEGQLISSPGAMVPR